jgi:hypothetical protein
MCTGAVGIPMFHERKTAKTSSTRSRSKARAHLPRLILEIRYVVPYPCGREYHRYKYMKARFISLAMGRRKIAIQPITVSSLL